LQTPDIPVIRISICVIGFATLFPNRRKDAHEKTIGVIK